MNFNSNRRDAIKGFAATTVLACAGVCSAELRAKEMPVSVVEGAKKEGSILWYDHFTTDEANKIFSGFQKEYPFVKNSQYVDVPAAQKQARLIQESLAGGPTSDIFLVGPAPMQQFVDQNLLVANDWPALGVAASSIITPTPYMIYCMSSMHIAVYNTKRVNAADIPQTWEDMVAPKWKGRVGAWSRAIAFVNLSSAWGEAKVTDYVKTLAALKPRLYGGTYEVAQAVGAGEVDVGMSTYDAATRVMEKGAPIKIVPLRPTPLSMIFGGILKYGKNPNTARLFLAWLNSHDGALAFDNVTHRGSYFVPETTTARALKDVEVTFAKPDEEVANAKQLFALEVSLSRLLQQR